MLVRLDSRAFADSSVLGTGSDQENKKNFRKTRKKINSQSQ